MKLREHKNEQYAVRHYRSVEKPIENRLTAKL